MKFRWPFMLTKTHENKVTELTNEHTLKLARKQARLERVQHGYDQGVLEGKRQAYVNLRATLADQMFMNPALRTLASILSHLGVEETRALDKMKGQEKAREKFVQHAVTEPSINMFPGNNEPQRAEHLADTPVKAPSPGEEEK